MGRIQETGTVIGYVHATRQAGGKILNRAPVPLGIVRKDHSFGSQSIRAEISSDKRVDGGIDPESGRMAFLDESLQVIEIRRPLSPVIGTPLPTVDPFQGRCHGRLEQDIARRRPDIHDDVGKSGLGNALTVFPDILPAVAIVIEVGGCVNPDIARLSHDPFIRRIGDHRGRIRSIPLVIPLVPIVRFAARKGRQQEDRYEKPSFHFFFSKMVLPTGR